MDNNQENNNYKNYLLIFVSCWALALFFANPAGDVMSNAILGAAASQAQNDSWEVELDYNKEVFDLAEVEEKKYSGMPPGLSVLAIPFYPIANWLSEKTPESWHKPNLFKLDLDVMNTGNTGFKDDYQFTTPKLIYWYQLLMVSLASATIPGFLGLIFYFQCLRAEIKNPILWSVALSIGSSIFVFSTVYSKEGISALFLALSYILARPTKDEHRLRIVRNMILSGLLCGASVASCYLTTIPAGLIILYSLIRNRWVTFFQIISCFAVILPLLVYHKLLFGGMFVTPYSFRMIETWTEHSKGLAGLTGLNFSALWGLTFSKFQGVFFYNPWLFLLIISFFILKRKILTKDNLFCLLIALSALLTISCGKNILVWSGAFLGLGPRHLVPTLPFLVFILIDAISKVKITWWHNILKILLAVSVLMQLAFAGWGGTLYPNPLETSLVWIGSPEALKISPIKTIFHEVFTNGLSTPILRIYFNSNFWGTLITALLVLLLFWKIREFSKRKLL
jgi:hypothetical protein